MSKRVFISVGETSGDQHAAGFIRELRALRPDVIIDAIGGPAMAAAGAGMLYDSVARAAMGLGGAARVFEIARVFKQIERHWLANKTDLLVCIDSSGMNLALAKRAKKRGLKVLYYIAPQLWASRPWRVKQVRKYVDRVACILPFEVDWYAARGVTATFVGHPLFDSLPADRLERSSAPPRFPDRPPVIGVVAGSRSQEIRGNLPKLMAVMKKLGEKHPRATFVLPTTSNTDELVREMLTKSPPVRLERCMTRVGAFDELVPSCDLVLCKSGTSTLHVAAYAVPMIVVYHAHRLGWAIVKRFVLKTAHVALVNVIAGQRAVVPELIGDWRPEDVSAIALDWLKSPAKLAAIRDELIDVVSPLAAGGASRKAAEIASELLR